MDRQFFSPGAAGGPGQDYILRMIEDFGVFLTKLAGRILNREFAEAAKQIEAYYREVLASDAGLIHTLSDTALIDLLKKNGGVDGVRFANLAKVLRLEADLASRPEAADGENLSVARGNYLLAFSLLMEVALAEGQSLSAEAVDELDSLAAKIADWRLPGTLAYKLFRYYEYRGRYGKAEDALFALKDSGFPAVLAEGREFYRRMSGLPDAKLAEGNLPRAELQDGSRHFAGPAS